MIQHELTASQKEKYNRLLEHFTLNKNKILIEGGTSLGWGTATAIQAGFEKIYTIELLKNLFEDAQNMFSNQIKSGQVVTINGDTQTVLGQILEEVNQTATFWLDAHFGKKYKGEKPRCPLLAELDVIKQHSIKTHTLLIDDMRLFGKAAHDFITIEQVKQKILEINPNYKISFLDSNVKNDILLAKI